MEAILEKLITEGSLYSLALLGGLVWTTRQWLKERNAHIATLKDQIEHQKEYATLSIQMKDVVERCHDLLEKLAGRLGR